MRSHSSRFGDRTARQETDRWKQYPYEQSGNRFRSASKHSTCCSTWLTEAELRLGAIASGLSGDREAANSRVIKVAVLATADTRPKDLSRVLDVAFEDWDAVLQFTVDKDSEVAA